MKLTRLKTNHQEHPCVDQMPYFSWVITSNQQNVMQTAYRIRVQDTQGVIWDSDIVESDQSTFVTYGGPALQSMQEYLWSVEVWDNTGDRDKAAASFETGLLQKEWKAGWVKSPYAMKKVKKGNGGQNPAEYFRRALFIKGAVKRARVYATCHGAYELHINGQRVDDRILAPEFTLYSKYLCYQTYDVTRQLHPGENVLGMLVGDGWYNSENFKSLERGFHKEHAVLFQMKIDYEDGAQDMIWSDGSEKVAVSPVRSSDLFAGELYDAREEISDWDCPGLDDRDWKQVLPENYGYENIIAQYGEPVRPIMEVPGVSMFQSPKGETIIDFGQMMAGFVRVNADIPQGDTLLMEYFETLDQDGNYFNNIALAENRGHLQIDRYISNGTAACYMPHFTYHGFRYLRVECEVPMKLEDFTAVVTSTDQENLGEFETSNRDINQLYQNTRWSQRSNMVSIPTDCPAREKGGWSGDIQIYAKTALLNENVTPFLTRWLDNASCNQMDNGAIPNVVPLTGIYATLEKLNRIVYHNHAPVGEAGWGDAICIIPWMMYEVTGNTQILRQQYAAMKKWCNYIITEARKHRGKQKLPKDYDQYLWNTGHQYGEWLIPSQTIDGADKSSTWKVNSGAYCAPIFGYNSCRITAQVAQLLGLDEDMSYYTSIADKMKHAIQQAVIGEDGRMPLDFMGGYVLAIAFDMATDKQQPLVAQHLIRKLEENQGCLDTGFLATSYLLDALCKIGRKDLAVQVLLQEKCPSWLYEVKKGATSIWENYVSYKEDGTPVQTSLNHYAFGCVDDWMFRKIGGIDSLEAGFKRILIKPEVTEEFSSATRRYLSEYGEITSMWRVDGERFTLQAQIPCNTTACIVLPDGSTHEVGSGSYEYAIKI